MSILKETHIITKKRQAKYGSPVNNLGLTAKLWSATLGIEVTPKQVALCMVQLKIAREVHLHDRDNIIDAIGYLSTIDSL